MRSRFRPPGGRPKGLLICAALCLLLPAANGFSQAIAKPLAGHVVCGTMTVSNDHPDADDDFMFYVGASTEESRETTVSRDLMDTIVENMLNSLIIVDRGFTIQSANQETLNLLGYAEKDLVGASIIAVSPSPCLIPRILA